MQRRPTVHLAARSRATLVTAAVLLCLASTRLMADPLPPGVVDGLRNAGIPLSHVAIYAQRQNSARPKFSHNTDRAMPPASVMKLVTTYAALDLLGPAHVWRTRFAADAPPSDGTVAGNLYIRGAGDPKITLERFWSWLRELRARGIDTIDGDVVLDQQLFSVPAQGVIDDAPLRAYNTPPQALLVNFNSIELRLANDADGGVRAAMMPAFSALALSNQLVAGAQPCENWREQVVPNLVAAPLAPVLRVEGVFPRACGERVMHLNLLSAERYIGELFKSLWSELGGRLTSVVRTGVTPSSASEIAVFDSEPLASVIRDINKFSNNVMARQLLLTLGTRTGTPATPQHGAAVVTQWLRTRNLAITGLEIDNGSGLSRRERVSARGLGRLLADAYRHPSAAEFASSLPIAGVDGTLKTRLADTPAAGHARLKTGALDNVRSIAGYVVDRSNTVWVVVALVDHPNAGKANAALDALVLAIREQGGRKAGLRRDDHVRGLVR